MYKYKILFFVLFLYPTLLFSQTVVYSDNMEDTGSTWKGIPKLLLNSYYTGGNSGSINQPINSNYFNSTDTSFALFGVGLGSSATERDTISYANVTGLDPTTCHRFTFKVASFGINPSVNTAAGVDGTDFVQIDCSLDGGLTWTKEWKITGNSNAKWAFNSPGISNYVYVHGGTFLTYPYAGSPITSMGVQLPLGTTQFAANIIMVTNAIGESWFIDDVQLSSGYCDALPIELLNFNGQYENNFVYLYWSTVSEINNDYFVILKSYDGINYEEIGKVDGSGNSSNQIDYLYTDEEQCDGIIYFKLKQVDYDGKYKIYDPIIIKCGNKEKNIIKIVNLIGVEVDSSYDGVKIYYYDDGSVEKKYE